jgi:hypothetical protein
VEQEAPEEDDNEEEEDVGQGEPVASQLHVSWILIIFIFIFV